MSSNMLAGDRRWATARRGGMTVLGKVAVPKPLNLPSQRLENHGLDPSVEIVPKGTLSWGSRSSSSGSNVWNSSSLSPNADGGNTSPSHLSGRPSSGGTGTRPSTAGSDRILEPVAGARSSNSRPSSASGTSNQSSSISLRPRSAETRPSSSQLSRFAEPISENSVAWGPSSTAERLGVKSSNEDGFSLSSGDFPTLGSEKENTVKNFESEDHGRPSSASGRINPSNEKNIMSQPDAEHRVMNELRGDGSLFGGAGSHPSMERWQGEPQQYFNPNVAPQHFDAWRGPPVNAPASMWYRGQPRGPPFGSPIAPGGFPMEPFPYFRPQLPPPALAGSQSAPRGSGPRGPHPQMGELYSPRISDAYAHAGVPFRPGFYPAPPGPMGYYGPPMGYGNNERDNSHMGIAAGPAVYNGYPGSSGPDIGHSRGRAGPSGKTMSEDVEAVHLDDSRGPKRGPLKSHDEWDQKGEGENWEHIVQPNFSYPRKGCLPMTTSRKNEWGAEDDAEEDIFAKSTIPSENSSRSFPHRDHSSGRVIVKKSFEGMGNVKADDNSWTNRPKSVPRFAPVMPQRSHASVRDSSLLHAKKDPDLIQKIEGLNAKVRASDPSDDAPRSYNKEQLRNRSEVNDLRDNTGEGRDTAGSLEKPPVSGDSVPVPQEVIGFAGNKPIQPMAVLSRRPNHGGQGRVDHHLKGYNNQDADIAQKKPLTPESCSSTIASKIGSVASIHVRGPSSVGEAVEVSAIDPVGKSEGESVAETFNSTATQAQREKARELAKQRALQLQKEEEERTREQKAKALAKLEELNRRTQACEAANQNAERTGAISDKQGVQEELSSVGEVRPEAPSTKLVSKPVVTVMDKDSSSSEAVESVGVSSDLPPDILQTVLLESNLSHDHSSPAKEDSDTATIITSQLDDVGKSRHKRVGYKQMQTSLLKKGSIEKSVSHLASGAQKDHSHVDTLVEAPSSELKPSSESNMQNTSKTVAEPSIDRRKKVDSTSKSKHRVNDAQAAAVFPPLVSGVNAGKESIINVESKDTLSNLNIPVSTVVEPNRGLQAQEAYTLPNEESQNRVTNHGKPQSLRRTPRSQHANRSGDKVHGSDVIWAPVRTKNKAEDSVEASQKSTVESAILTKSGNMAQNNLKGKRAEIERYIPKPVAKEIAQQASVSPLSSSVSSSKSDEALGMGQCVSSQSPLPVSFASGLVGSNVEIKEADDRHKKHKKEIGQWRQRGTTDSSHMKGVNVGPFLISEPTKDIQQPTEHNQFVKSEKDTANTEVKTSGNVDSSGWYDISKNTTAGELKGSSVKDQGATGRGKRHVPRGPRSTANNHKNILSGETDGSYVQYAATDNDSDRTVASKENRSFREQTSSHWQPKSHSSSTHSQHGNKSEGSEPVNMEMKKLSGKDRPQRKVQVPLPNDEEGSKSVIESNIATEAVVAHHQESNRQRKAAPTKGRSYSPNLDPVVSTAANADGQLERHMSSDSRKNGSQNRQFARGYESRGDWYSGQNNRPHNIPAFRERQKQNVHYEYHPVGSSKDGKPEKLDEPADGGQIYRERGQNYPKRGGNSYRRQSGAVRVKSDQDWSITYPFVIEADPQCAGFCLEIYSGTTLMD